MKLPEFCPYCSAVKFSDAWNYASLDDVVGVAYNLVKCPLCSIPKQEGMRISEQKVYICDHVDADCPLDCEHRVPHKFISANTDSCTMNICEYRDDVTETVSCVEICPECESAIDIYGRCTHCTHRGGRDGSV